MEYFSMTMAHIVSKHVVDYNNVHMYIVNKILKRCLFSLKNNCSEPMRFNILNQQTKKQTKELVVVRVVTGTEK
jgi:hypothetical protein